MSDAVGSAAEEALKLLSAVQDWARTRFDTEHLATGSSECQVCPVCQAVALARQVKPETVEHLIDAAASFVAALKSSLTPPGPASPDGPGALMLRIRALMNEQASYSRQSRLHFGPGWPMNESRPGSLHLLQCMNLKECFLATARSWLNQWEFQNSPGNCKRSEMSSRAQSTSTIRLKQHRQNASSTSKPVIKRC